MPTAPDEIPTAAPSPSPAPAAAPRWSLRGLDERRRDLLLHLLVFLGALALYLPFAGSYGLWDPWETHYAEVARQMTARGDFISLWWPGSPRETAVFQTKPVLTYWLMSLGMMAAGIGAPGGPDAEMAIGSRAEWAVRTPFCLLGALGIWAVYHLGARLGGRRVGLLAALCTAGFPMYALVARQAMTDMAFVGPMTLALALGALALEDRGDRPPDPLPRRGPGWASSRWLRWLRWPRHPLFYVALGLFLVATVPQLLVDSIDLRVRVPWGGQARLMYGVVAMLPYWVGVLAVVAALGRMRQRGQLQLAIAATLCGLAVLGKGIAGLGLPVLVFAAYLAISGRWRRLRERDLLVAVALGLVMAALVAVPWHHAMFIRHGAPWWNELYGDNHWKRLMVGRHGDRGTFEYFLRELGYGTWPLVALALPALAAAVWRPPADERRRALVRFGAVWFVTAYALVSLSMTKFHHYLLPALPGLGLVLGAYLEDLLAHARGRARAVGLAALVGLPLLLAVTFDLVVTRDAPERFLWLFSYDYIYSAAGRVWPDALELRPWIYALAGAMALATAALAWPRLRRRAVAAVALTGVAVALFVNDVFMPAVAPSWSQKQTIAQYYRQRASADERLIAYRLFWRGETFYTKNAIYEGPEDERTVFDHWDDTDARLQAWLSRHRGHRQFFVFEPSQEGRLRGLLPPEARASFQVVFRRNNKFVLGVAQL
jgi:4-amino-4-deoxy-L-arabinose transferase-like glycosyltransferase